MIIETDNSKYASWYNEEKWSAEIILETFLYTLKKTAAKFKSQKVLLWRYFCIIF